MASWAHSVIFYNKRDDVKVGAKAFFACYHACNLLQRLVLGVTDSVAVVDATAFANLAGDQASFVSIREGVGASEGFRICGFQDWVVELSQSILGISMWKKAGIMVE